MKAPQGELIEALKREEDRAEKENELLGEAEELLQQGFNDDERILELIRHAHPNDGPNIDPEGLEEDRIFSERAIRELCIKYRLRFLSSRHFMDELPYDALHSLKAFEKTTGQEALDLRIVAPGERFRLQDSKKDPLLFVHLGNGKHYLIHRWGKDLSKWRKTLHYPVRDISTLITTCALLAMMISVLLPAQVFQAGEGATTELIVLFRAMSFFLLSSFFMTATLIIGVTSSKEFSADQWNSKFFN